MALDNRQSRRTILRTSVLAVAAACRLTHSVQAQSPADRSTPVGVWRGTSSCTVRPSACNDEVVVYRISRGNTSDSLRVDGRRIVNGQEEEMGVLGCRLTGLVQLVCTIPRGVWRFTVRADSLVGELRRADSTNFRDVRTVRSH